METKHIQKVTENDNSVTITFEKDDDSNKKGDRKVPDSNSSVLGEEQKEQVTKPQQEENKASVKMENQEKDIKKE